jgi:hypothetical protein
MISVVSADPTLQRLHDARTPNLRLVMGNTGRIDCAVSGLERLQGQRSRLVLRVAGRAEVLARQSVLQNTPLSFGALAPGEYEVTLETRSAASQWSWAQHGASVRTTLDAEQLTRQVALSP